MRCCIVPGADIITAITAITLGGCTWPALQVLYEAGLWQLLELLFLDPAAREGYFVEVRLEGVGVGVG